MLRLAVLLLLLANAGYFAWSQGLLRAVGLAPGQTSEPQLMQRQIKPQALRILRDDEVRGFERQPVAQSGVQPECMLAGPIDEAQIAGIKQVLQPWPAGSWSLEPAAATAAWIVYMGRYDNKEQVARKQAELRQIGVRFEPLPDPALEPGLSLGRYATEAAAGEQLQALAQRGVRSAKVVPAQAETHEQVLKLAVVDDTLRPRLQELRPVLNTIKWRPCR